MHGLAIVKKNIAARAVLLCLQVPDLSLVLLALNWRIEYPAHAYRPDLATSRMEVPVMNFPSYRERNCES